MATSTTYIFAIGGTGSRVLRSLSMFLAAGCEGTAVPSEIVPIILDYDRGNGDLTRTRKVLERYDRIHRAIYNDKIDENKSTFFATPVKKMKDKDGEAMQRTGIQFNPKSGYDAYLEEKNEDYSSTFSEFLGLDSMTKDKGILETYQLLTSLYNNEKKGSPMTELNMDFVQGFLGCPNIGCLVSKNFTNTEEYKSALGNFRPQSDKILIIGSVFGGTGASGIPMLLDELRRDQRTVNAKIAVLAMLPYYKIVKKDDSPVDSETFMAKTKAAVTTYALPGNMNEQADRIYYVGDPNMGQPFANNPGKDEQKNNALFAEFVAAMCVVDYMQRPLAQIVKGEAFECGLKDSAPVSYNSSDQIGMEKKEAIGWENFYQDETIEPYIEPLMRFAIFEKFCREYMPEKVQDNDTWYVTSGLDEKIQFVEDVREFGSDLFDWLDELAGPQRPLQLFNPKSDGYDHFLTHKELVSGRLRKKHAFTENDIADGLGLAFKNNNDNMSDRQPEYKFIMSADKAMREISHKIENFKK